MSLCKKSKISVTKLVEMIHGQLTRLIVISDNIAGIYTGQNPVDKHKRITVNFHVQKLVAVICLIDRKQYDSGYPDFQAAFENLILRFIVLTGKQIQSVLIR